MRYSWHCGNTAEHPVHSWVGDGHYPEGYRCSGDPGDAPVMVAPLGTIATCRQYDRLVADILAEADHRCTADLSGARCSLFAGKATA